MDFPDDLMYTRDHEWLRLEGNICTVGITDYAQRELIDIVFVEFAAAARETVDRLLAKGILAGVDLAQFGGDPSHLMIAVTEKRTKAEIDALAATLGEIA